MSMRAFQRGVPLSLALLAFAAGPAEGSALLGPDPGGTLLDGPALGGTVLAADTLRYATTADAEYRRGVELLAADDARGASAAFERALALDYRPRAQAYLQLGLSHRRLPLHTFDAIRAFRSALREHPSSPEALYELADTYLALDGWEGQREARRAFVTILEQDPSFRDAYDRWSALYPDAGESGRVASAFRKRLETDFSGELALRTARLYLRMEREEGAPRKGKPSEADAVASMGPRLFSRGRELEDLLEIWTAAEPVPSVLRHYVTARLLFRQGKDGTATEEFRAGLNVARTPADLEPYWGDLAPIVDAGELASARDAQLEDQVAFLAGFWEARDPLPFSESNERVAEQYRRIAEAWRRYLWKKPLAKETVIGDYVDDLGRPSFDTRLEGPILDDRGTIYLRHGEPDQRHVEVGGSEFWRYERADAPGRRLQFHFKLMDGPMGRGNDTVYSMLPTTEIGEANVRLGHARQEGVENTLLGLSTDSFVPAEAAGIPPLPMLAATFRNAEDRSRTDLLLAWATVSDPAAAAAVARLKLYDERYAQELALDDTVETRTFTTGPRDDAARTGVSGPDRPAVSGADEARLSGAFQISSYPGERPYAVQVEGPGARILALGRGAISLPSYAGDGLQVSDLVLSRSVQPAASDPTAPTRGGLALRPLVDAHVSRSHALALYYEIYELRAGEDDRARYRIEYRVSSDRPVSGALLRRIFGGGVGEAAAGQDGTDRVTFAFEKKGREPAERVVETISLDLSALPPGGYEVAARIRDVTTGAEVERRARFVLAP